MKPGRAEIGIIGGTGIYSDGMLEDTREISIRTKYGKPSSKIRVGSFRGKRVAFIFRHGERHSIPPHKVNSHANIEALKKVGVGRIIGIAAVGSLQGRMKPGHIVIPDQFIDMTKLRRTTFYEGPKVAHVSMAEPFCDKMREVAIERTGLLEIPFHRKGTYLCVEGPRFSTRAESNLWRMMKADVVGMTLLPEVTLAREREICYLSINSVTDYDCWKSGAVSANDVTETMKRNIKKVNRMVSAIIPRIPRERSCACSKALEKALL